MALSDFHRDNLTVQLPRRRLSVLFWRTGHRRLVQPRRVEPAGCDRTRFGEKEEKTERSRAAT